MNIKPIQAYLTEHDLDGWLMADFHSRNTVAVTQLELTGMVSRRSFYFIPAEGEPVRLVHAIEKDKFEHLPGKEITFTGYKQLESSLATILNGVSGVAMEYSPKGRLPYIGLVEAGTIELVREFGVKIVSSADLVANFQARLSVDQIAAHRTAANNLIEIKDSAFDFIRQSLTDGKSITEYDVQQFVMGKFEEFDLTTEFPPICGVDGNAGNPHYEPDATGSATIKRDQLILLDLWAKTKSEHGVYGDITWMAFAGPHSDLYGKHDKLFKVIAEARDTAVAFIQDNIGSKPVHGADVDDVCRAVIEKAGYGEYFTHRTGHSIASSEHGPGPNIDNLETEDSRRLQEGHLFSIEPGIYMADRGLRTEIDVLITPDGAEVTTLPLQTEITALF